MEIGILSFGLKLTLKHYLLHKGILTHSEQDPAFLFSS